MKKFFSVLLVLLVMTFFCGSAYAVTLFEDDFNDGADTAWGNEIGSWNVSDGVYSAGSPSNNPPTYSSVTTLTGLTNFTLDVTVNGMLDGGIWLRSKDSNNGVLLVTGGYGSRHSGFYWHIFENGAYSGAMGEVTIPGLLGSNVDLKVVVDGDVYQLFVNGSDIAATTLITDKFSSGTVGLYDFSAQTFDNFKVTATPEPASMALFGLGGLILAVRRKK
ncbi:MAG TPA: PEP-CTERM sorting domain-containing protein [Candidatus Omnitrophota bacterium]|nr:PEP-CTERM sorting domain-containing protein [Candidatus Omnitrophota bacterium]